VSESLVPEALEKLMVGSSCVAIAHRLSTNQKSNCVAVIKKGKVAEQGCHKEILALGRDGAYYFVTEPQTGSSLFH
jgi:ATP-binding cassette subfamily B (MDR/TAP) protein 1